jgi:hypothetical protein
MINTNCNIFSLKFFCLLVLSALSFTSVFGLSCMQPDPIPSLRLAMAQNRYETIGVVKIIDFESEGFMYESSTNDLSMNRTATGEPRKFTTHAAEWKILKKGTISNPQFLLKINATSWMGNVTRFEPGQIITITSEAVIDAGELVLSQDFGCGRNEWDRYSAEDIEGLETKTVFPKTYWQRFVDWVSRFL